jgi:hypothetical protein
VVQPANGQHWQFGLGGCHFSMGTSAAATSAQTATQSFRSSAGSLCNSLGSRTQTRLDSICQRFRLRRTALWVILEPAARRPGSRVLGYRRPDWN